MEVTHLDISICRFYNQKTPQKPICFLSLNKNCKLSALNKNIRILPKQWKNDMFSHHGTIIYHGWWNFLLHWVEMSSGFSHTPKYIYIHSWKIKATEKICKVNVMLENHKRYSSNCVKPNHSKDVKVRLIRNLGFRTNLFSENVALIIYKNKLAMCEYNSCSKDSVH